MASSAQIAANRAASNSFKHGFHAPRHFQVLNAVPNFTSALIHNSSDEFQPVTPSEHILLQQLVHQQIRYQHIQAHYTVLINYYGSKPGTPKTTLVCQEELEDALSFERLANDTKVLPLLLRELDRMPTRIRRTMEALRARLKGLPGNYLWNLLLRYTFEDHPEELAYFYSEREAEKAETEAAKAEQAKQENPETNPIAA